MMAAEGGDVVDARRVGVKQQPWARDAAARRRATLAQQRQARRDLTAHARALAGGEDGDTSASEDEGPPPRGPPPRGPPPATGRPAGPEPLSKRRTREERVKRRRERFCRQLMVPEWLVDAPRDLNGRGSALGEGWYVLPRPEGTRCLVVASGGRTTARAQSGGVLRRFPSALPGGSHRTNRGGDASCILDCVFQEHGATFYVLDVMCWKSYLLYNCTTEFRWYWARDKLAEAAAGVQAPANPFRFLPIPCYESDPEGIQAAYATTFPFIKDGLLFYMKAAHYEMGLSPLALVWKDERTSRYLVFTDKPAVVLRLDAARNFATLEGVVLTAVDDAFVRQHELSEGDLAKFTFDAFEPGADPQTHPPVLRGLAFVKRCSPQRALADSWTKILFQYNARTGGVRIEQILEAARTPAAEMETEMAA